jgi:mono/diheme cytochrome c family protein
MTQLVKQIIADLFGPLCADLRLIPVWMRWAVIVITCASTIPLALIFRARSAYSDQPRIHIIQNMDNQPKFVSQEVNMLFLDGRTMRPRVEGTIARGEMVADTHFFMGVVQDAWATEFPSSLVVDRAFIKRGQNRFNIYCALCHGAGGYGDGLIHQRAKRLVETGVNGTSWVAPKNIHEDEIREQPVGQLFNTVTNGVRTMSGYASQIPTEDRWAIIAYVRALQVSRHADPSTVSDSDTLPRWSITDEGSNQ